MYGSFSTVQCNVALDYGFDCTKLRMEDTGMIFSVGETTTCTSNNPDV